MVPSHSVVRIGILGEVPDLISVERAVEEFEIGRNTLFRHMRDGRLKRYKGGIGDHVTYVDRQELKRLVKPSAAQ